MEENKKNTEAVATLLETQNKIIQGIKKEFAITEQYPIVTPLDEILDKLLSNLQKIDFDELANPELVELKQQYNNEQDAAKQANLLKRINSNKTQEKEKYVIIITEILKHANINDWDICQNGNNIFVFNGAYWEPLDEGTLKQFLGKCAERLGLKPTKAKQYEVKDSLLKQFFDTGFRSKIKSERILSNLQNGTFEVTPDGKHKLRCVCKEDFLTYQLPFEYNEQAVAPKFMRFLNEVLPDAELQTVLAEFLGYVFIPNLKLEKALFLYGSGANGKSVFFDIVMALFGRENITTNNLESLCSRDDYRADLENKLINYASEVGSRTNSDIFKQMASGETLTVRQLYGKTYQISNYARLIFNANTLPRDTEQTNAFYRRFMIIPFNVTIAPEKQNPNLAKEIIKDELAGIFNWILAGLDRLVKNQKFSECKTAKEMQEQYQLESDSVLMFLKENDYIPSRHHSKTKLLKEFYCEYRDYCNDNGYKFCSSRTVADRLRKKSFIIRKTMGNNVVEIERYNKIDDLF